MKNLLLIAALLFGAYLYSHPRVETVPQAEVPQAPVAAAAPQKLYFHSPLDAPAMSTGAATGTGYYSADPSSRFSNYQPGYNGSSSSVAGGYPVYAGGLTTNNVTYNQTNTNVRGTSSAPAPVANSFVAGKLVNTRSTNADKSRRTNASNPTNY